MRRLAREAEVPILVPPVAAGEESPWEKVDSWSWEDPAPLVRVLWGVIPEPYTFVVEKDRIVVMTRESAARFWKEWKP